MCLEDKKNYPYLRKIEKAMEEAKTTTSKASHMKRKYIAGSSQIAKKLGEESVEMVIASQNNDDEHFLEESADVLYYYLLSIHNRGYKLDDVLNILKKRNRT